MTSSAFAGAAIVALLLLAGGCGEATSAGGGAPAGVDGAWELRDGVGPGGVVKPVDGHRITLVLDGRDVSGSSGCNSYSGSARVDGDRFSVDGLGSTEMACEPRVMAVEAAYVGALRRVGRIRRDGDELVLGGPSGELAFRRVLPVPAKDVVGTTWRLDTVIRGETASTPVAEATLRLGRGGSIAGTTGCRAFTGTYVLRGDEVVTTRLSLQDDPLAGRCAPAGERQEALVVAVLGDGVRAEVEGDRLTLTAQGEDGLVYRAR